MQVPWRKTLFFVSLGIKFQDFLSFLFILRLSYSKPFHNTLNYASTANIEEVMKFYNLGKATITRCDLSSPILLYSCYVIVRI